jgi:hypothetical protein
MMLPLPSAIFVATEPINLRSRSIASLGSRAIISAEIRGRQASSFSTTDEERTSSSSGTTVADIGSCSPGSIAVGTGSRSPSRAAQGA